MRVISSEGDVMEEPLCPYSVLDVASLLQSKYAFVSGGKAKNGAPIMTFPENPKQPDIPEDDYRKLVSYLCYVPALHETEQGFVIVLDRRQESWAAVKTMLLRISGFFPKHIQVVFLLQPHGFFQRAFADSKSKFVKEELEFKVVLCNGPEEMFDYIDPHQLTREVGGVLEYDANEWTQHRSAVEKFLSNTEKISTAVQAKVKKFQDTEIPNDVKGMEAIIRDHNVGRQEILDDLSSGDTQGKTLLDCIKGDNPRTPFIHQTHVVVLERLLVQLEETKKKFEEFWEKHESRLGQCMQLRQFEEEFKSFQYIAGKRIDWLNNKMSEVGESVQQVDELAREFEEFIQEAEKDVDQGEKMKTSGEQLIMDDHYAVDSIRPKCIELQRMCDQYRQLLRRRRELLEKSHDLQDRIDNANKWCNKGIDLLANQQLEQGKSQEGADLAVNDIENFVKTSSQLRLNNPKEFRQLFEGMITPETRTSVQKVLKRIEDVHGMCESRKDQIRKLVSVPKRPVQAVKPEPVPTAQVDGDLKRKGTTENTYRHPDIYEKSARLRTDITQSRPYITPPSPAGGSFSSLSDSLSDKARNSYSSMSTTTSSGSSVSDLDTMMAKRRHVLNELIETEKTYVTQLEDILKGYCYEMDNRHMQHLIPEELIGKKEILFGNLEQIYNFHKNIFLHELQNCQDAPAKVGKCFVHRNEEFHLYSIYCQNKLRSEALRNQIGDQNPFFMECQRRLRHKLPLGAYLLKPVQRITKYQLLLKEMLRFTDHDRECETQLQEALDSMLDVVRYVNDSMHQVSIVGFPGNLSDQGRLLMQGGFTVSTEHKKEKIKDLRFKPMHRHMFLYEKSILLCKKKEDLHQHSEKRIYSFKNLLNMAQVGLTENIKGDKKKFELWLRGREEVYIIQAPSLPVKEMWVKEIKRVLMNQFDQIKVTKYLNLSNQSQEDLSQPDLKGSTNSNYIDNWRSQGYNNNTSSTVPVGIEMMSPESPPGGTQDDEEDGWSSGEFSNSDEDTKKDSHNKFSSPEPNYLQKFQSIGDYNAVDSTEVSLREGDMIQVLRTGSTGWWYARHMVTNQEGWVPSTFLQPALKAHSHLSVSSGESSQENITSKSSITSAYSTTSPVEETTV